ncbi:MFS transporter [Glycomyces buryatensis]|uniref:MFS transporter n=1 Tax=Glycomyces buryatensis TaxID=2570927 RepID=A0A4S8PX63_9ACTN|nr:MFS transporter [Glycomyces buryatensis]THV34655.1 MFS transporter [Glycomyces buryatensis]
MRQTPFRLLRAAVFAAVTVSASALLHLWSGGSAPKPLFFTAAMALAFAAAFALGGRQRGFLALAPLCLAAQWGMHELFATGSPVAAGHEHGSGLPMLAVHCVAALAQAAWLARGEAALAALLDLLTLFFARVMRVCLAAVPAPVHTRRSIARTPAPRPHLVGASAISLRGPPPLAL